MAIPKGALKNIIKSSMVLKSDEPLILYENNTNLNTKLTFKKEFKNLSTSVMGSLNTYFFLLLSKNEKKIIMHLFEKKDRVDSEVFITKAIDSLSLSVDLNISVLTLKKIIQRLQKKGFISRYSFKAGRDGWTIYSIPINLLKELRK